MHRETDRVAVIIVNYGASELLSREMSSSGIESESDVFVVDNFSGDSERSAIEKLCSRNGWTLIPNSENVGFGRAVDQGMVAARDSGHRAALILNPDAWIEPSAVLALLDILKSNPGAIVSPKIFKPDGTVWMENTEFVKVRGLARHAPDLVSHNPIIWLTAACLMLEISTWSHLGGFDPDYFLYWEDVDLTYRHSRQGGKLFIAEHVRAVHAVGGTQKGSASKSRVYMAYNARNRLLFARKNLGLPFTALWALTTPYFLFVLMRTAQARTARTALDLFGAAVGGCIDGLKTPIRQRS